MSKKQITLQDLIGASHRHGGRDRDREIFDLGGYSGEIKPGDIVKLPTHDYTYPVSIRGRVGRITSINTYFSQCADCRIKLQDGKIIRADFSDVRLVKKATKEQIKKDKARLRKRVWNYKS